MKYNCLRTNPYVKMFVVGLLLYLGETVFFKCSEEGTFIVKVQTGTGATIKVPDCKGTDKLSEFMKKFEKAFDATYTNVKIKDISYNLKYNAKPLVMGSMPRKDATLVALGIGKTSILHFFECLNKTEGYTDQIDFKMFKKYKDKNFLNIDKEIKNIKKRSGSFEKLHTTYITKEEEDTSTSTCPLRRCCRICGC